MQVEVKRFLVISIYGVEIFMNNISSSETYHSYSHDVAYRLQSKRLCIHAFVRNVGKLLHESQIIPLTECGKEQEGNGPIDLRRQGRSCLLTL